MNVSLNQLPPHVIIWGGTGQAKVMRPIMEHYGAKVVAVFWDADLLFTRRLPDRA